MVGPFSAIQPSSQPLTFNFPWSLCYIRKLAFWSPWENYFSPGIECNQHTGPRYIILAQTLPSQGTNIHNLVEWSLSLRYSFLQRYSRLACALICRRTPTCPVLIKVVTKYKINKQCQFICRTFSILSIRLSVQHLV